MAYQKLTPIIATGATAPRYIGDRFGDIVNLRDFGAVGDGETDDSTAWAAWQTALQSGGMPYIPKGNYLLGEEIIHAPKGHFGRNINNFLYEDSGAVLSEFDASVYVDASVVSSGDGFSKTTALKTIGESLAIAEAFPSAKIIIAGGTYTENIYIEKTNYLVELSGNVTVNGNIDVLYFSNIKIKGNYSLTVSGYINVKNNSIVCFDCGGVAVESSEDVAVSIDECSEFISKSNTSITATDADHVLLASRSTITIDGVLNIVANNTVNGVTADNSNALYKKTVYISGSGCYTCLRLNGNSTVVLEKGLKINNDSNMSMTSAVAVLGRSYLHVKNGEEKSVVKTPQSCSTSVYASDFSYIMFDCDIYIRNNNQSGVHVEASKGSLICFSKAVEFDCSSSINHSLVARNSCIDFRGSDKVKASGGYNICFALIENLSKLLFSNARVVENYASGSRYIVRKNSIINVESAGENRLPGSSNGSSSDGGYYF